MGRRPQRVHPVGRGQPALDAVRPDSRGVEADRVVPGRQAGERAAPVRSGRGVSRRGRDTRQRLLDGTRDLLDESSYRAVRVVDIARAAGTSPATFYQY